MRKRRRKPIHFDLFGDPIGEPQQDRACELMTLDFESHAVRVIVVKGEPWWMLSDVARVLGYRDAEQAKRLLKTKHWTTTLSGTTGFRAGMLIINEAGLYRLMMRSDKSEAERFQDWVTDEVLPSIRRTGTYTHHRHTRISQVARRLRTDRETAKIRCDQIDVNKASNARLAAEKAVPNQFREYHNACYRGQFDGMEARQLREVLGLKGHETPLDHMDGVVLSANHHAKVVADRQIREREKIGRPIPLSEQPKVVEATSREVSAAVLEKLGRDYIYGITQDPRRGMMLDVVRKQLAAS